MKKILITGIAGFIGSNLAREIRKRHPECEIVGMDNFSSGNFRNVSDLDVLVYPVDISRYESIKYFENYEFDTIFHLASNTNTTDFSIENQFANNFIGFQNILLLGQKNKTKNIVYASSASTYGNFNKVVSENNKPNPLNLYAYSKCQMDLFAKKIIATKNVSFVLTGLRYFNVYGRGETYKGKSQSMVSQLISQLKDSSKCSLFEFGEQKRDFVYIKDVVNQTIESANNLISDIYNCGSGKAISFNEVVETICYCLKIKGKKINYIKNPHEGYQNFTCADMSKVKKIFGFEPKFDIISGIEDYLNAKN